MTPKAPSSTTASLGLLFRLIQSNDWQMLHDAFLSDARSKKFQHLAEVVSASTSFGGMTLLHATVRFDPPPALVRRMVELCPDAPSSRDYLDRTPLHVAAGTDAGAAVVRSLVEAYPEACDAKDEDGRTPLHMACDAECELFEDPGVEKRKKRRELSYPTIRILLSASPGSAVLEDNDETTAIEYALMSDAELETVKLLQRAAQRVMRKKLKEERADKAKRSYQQVITRETRTFAPKALLGAPMA